MFVNIFIFGQFSLIFYFIKILSSDDEGRLPLIISKIEFYLQRIYKIVQLNEID